MGKFSYQSRPAEAWQARGEQKGGGFISYLKDSVPTFSPQPHNWVRIMPPTWDNPQHYGYDVWLHQYIGPQQATVLCPLKHNKGKCPVCEAYSKGEAQGKDYDSLYEFKAVRRVLAYFLNRNAERENKDCIQAWAMPWKFDRDVSKLCRDPITGELYQIDHPEAGFDLTFDKDGEPPTINYSGAQIARNPSSVSEKWLDYVVANPLPNCLHWRTYDEIMLLFEGASQESAPQTEQGNPQTQQQAPVQGQQTQPQTQQAQPQAEAKTNLPDCDKGISAGGRMFGCTYKLGHEGNCDFQVDKGPIQSQTSPATQPSANGAAGTSPATTAVVSAQPADSAAATATASPSSQPTNTRASALRARFSKDAGATS
jgi:hypothetical protein